MPRTGWILPALLLVTVSQTSSKTVVFLPFPVTSHARVCNIVGNELAQMGHKVWLAVPSAYEKRTKANSKQTSAVKTFSYGKFMTQTEDIIVHGVQQTLQDGKLEEDWSAVLKYHDILSEDHFHAMKDRGLIDHIQKLKPDLIVLDWAPRVNELVAIPYKLDIPFAVLSPIYDPVTGRIPFNPMAELSNSLYFPEQASLYEEVTQLFNLMYPLFHDSLFDRGYISKIAPEKNKISASEVFSGAEVYVFENDHILDHPKPTLPNVKFVGGISAGPVRDLQEPFRTFIRKSEKDGVGLAIVSFGSLVLNLPSGTLAKFFEVFNQLKLNVIWRANVTSPNPDKILTSVWLPQNDLLGQKNVKVFITHCGIHGLYEGLYHAVPIVCLPIFYDQFLLSKRTRQKGYGVSADFTTDSVEELVKTIEDAAYGLNVRSNITKASEIYHQLYKNPGKEAAFWFDHVMRYGGSYMRYSGQKMPMSRFIFPYILFILIGVFVTLICFFIAFVLKRLCTRCYKRRSHIKRD